MMSLVASVVIATESPLRVRVAEAASATTSAWSSGPEFPVFGTLLVVNTFIPHAAPLYTANSYNSDNTKGWKGYKSNDMDNPTLYDWNGSEFVLA